MSKTVEIKTGFKQVMLPNGRAYDAGASVVLTDAQYAAMSPTAQTNVVTLIASTTDGAGSDETGLVTAEQARATAAEGSEVTARGAAVTAEQVRATAAEGAEATARGAADLTFLPKAGGTLTGPLVLAGDGSANLHPASYQQLVANGSSGRELASAESTTAQTGITTVLTDITGLTITFTVAARPVYVLCLLPFLQIVTASATVIVFIADAANVEKSRGGFGGAAGTGLPTWAIERISAAGTYTRKIQVQRAAGTGTISNNLAATPTCISRLWAQEA